MMRTLTERFVFPILIMPALSSRSMTWASLIPMTSFSANAPHFVGILRDGVKTVSWKPSAECSAIKTLELWYLY